MAFRITTKNGLQSTLRRRKVDSAIKRKTRRQVFERHVCLRAGRWQHTSTRPQYRWLTTEGNWKCFLFWLLGGLLSTQEARAALGCRLVKLLRLFSAKQPAPACIHEWLHATRLPFLNYLAPFICLQGPLLKNRFGLNLGTLFFTLIHTNPLRALLLLIPSTS